MTIMNDHVNHFSDFMDELHLYSIVVFPYIVIIKRIESSTEIWLFYYCFMPGSEYTNVAWFGHDFRVRPKSKRQEGRTDLAA